MDNFMKLINFVLFVFVILCLSCQDDNSPMVTEEPPTELEPERCINIEEATSEASGFLVFDKGLQENGNSSGIKINKEWEASSSLAYSDTYHGLDSTQFGVINLTYWRGVIGGYDYGEFFTTAEVFLVWDIPLDVPMGCYSLSDNETNIAQGLIDCSYSLNHDDQWIASYQLDRSAENHIEIIKYDQENEVFVAKLEASFFTDENPGLPEYPDSLRFFNVDIVIGAE